MRWFITCWTAPRGSPENMAGTHGNYLLWLGDEASGTCQKQIYDSEARRRAEVGRCETSRRARRRDWYLRVGPNEKDLAEAGSVVGQNG